MSAPRVSVCIPAHDAGDHLEETLASVWAQDDHDFEVVVVDDGSSDGTAAILAAQTDPRLRVYRHPRNRGQRRAVGEAVGQARGELIKFLDADDLLRSDCIGKMARALDDHPSAAFVFSPREIRVEDPGDPRVAWWLEHLSTLHDGFGGLEELNDGTELLRRYLQAGLGGNWVAEPAGVMARRASLLRAGGYALCVRQNTDMDLWVRLMALGDVAFLDEPLYTYRLALSGVTGSNDGGERHWLDTLWIAEGLIATERFPLPAELRRARRTRLIRALRRAASDVARRRPGAARELRDLAAYGRHRATPPSRRPALHDDLVARLDPLSSGRPAGAVRERTTEAETGPATDGR